MFLSRVTKNIAWALAFASCAGSIRCAEAQPIDWLEDRDVAAAMAQEVSVTWSGVPLRDALRRFAGTHRMAVVLDRRVDPGQPITAALSDVSFEDALERLTRTRKLGFAVLGSAIYVGPPQAAVRLRTVAALRRQEANVLPKPRRSAVLDCAEWEWGDFSEPAELLVQLARESGMRLEGIDRVPHDLWAGTILPPLTLIDRLTLVANQFDLTFEFSADGGTLRLVPVAENPTIERRYAGGPDPRGRARRFQTLLPDAQIEIENGRLLVRGRIEDHERLAAANRSHPSARKPAAGKEVYQLKLENVPVGKVIEELGRRLNLTVRIHEEDINAAGLSLEKLVTVRVKDATIDELLEAVLTPAGLVFRRDGSQVDVKPSTKR